MGDFYELVAGWSRAGLVPGMFEHAFIVRGVVAALVVGPLLGGMGTLVVTKQLSFFTQTLGHASLTGVALGLLLGEPLGETYAGLYGFSLLVALLTVYVRNRTHAAADTVVGVVLAQVLGLGIVLLVAVTKRFDVHQVEAVLFGSLIALGDADLAVIVATAAVAAPFLLIGFNQSLFTSFNPVLARARGRDPIVSSDYVLVAVLTLIVVASLKIIGALLVLVLVVLPAASAQNIARSLRGFFWLSALFGGISALSGLLISATWPVPTGGAIVLAASVLFYSTLLLQSLMGRASLRQGEI